MMGSSLATQIQGVRLCRFSAKTGQFRLCERTGGLGGSSPSVWRQGRPALLKSEVVEGHKIFLTFHCLFAVKRLWVRYFPIYILSFTLFSFPLLGQGDPWAVLVHLRLWEALPWVLFFPWSRSGEWGARGITWAALSGCYELRENVLMTSGVETKWEWPFFFF